ncbi:MAG TPA: hypothetical protein PKD86_08725 [Gemmatales bacterium]|nr:hypothetical protein [Gemmatales bacterium]
MSWSAGFVGESHGARWIDPFVSRKIDVGAGSPPRLLFEGTNGFVEQFVDWNADNDNGSLVTDYIPAVRDYEVGFTPDENDVVPLILEQVPPGGTYPGIVEFVRWRLEVSYSGEGRLRFWDSPDKRNELIPSGEWQFTPSNKPGLQGQGSVPAVHLEGMEPSSEMGDIIVSFAVETQFVGGVTQVTQFKQNKVTVTPVLKEFNVMSIDAPYFGNKGDKPPHGDGSASEIEGRIELRARYIHPNVAERVGFVQFLTRFTNDLEGSTIARMFTNGYKDQVALMSPAQQQQQGLGPNSGLPLLDSDNDNKPWYHKVPQVAVSPADRLYEISMNDHPGSNCGVELKEVGWSDFFSTYVAWMHHEERTGLSVLTPLARLNWEMHFRFTG